MNIEEAKKIYKWDELTPEQQLKILHPKKEHKVLWIITFLLSAYAAIASSIQ